MAFNRVVDDRTRKVLYTCSSLQEAADWMIERKDELDWYEVYAVEVDEDESGVVLGWWNLDDLLPNKK